MRASPAFQVVLERFGVWRGAVFVAALAGVLVMAGGLMAQAPAAPAIVRWAAAVLGLVLLAWGVSAARVRPVSLRWDGQLWHLGAPDSAGHEPASGELQVALDLGPWMLLRFRPGASTWRTRATWRPVQRRGLEPQWHALRCAVYSPRPPLAADAAAGF